MESFENFSERLDITARIFVPYMLLALLFILNVIAVPYPLTGLVKAPFFLMGIYYWSIYRPTLLPVWAVFVIGLLMDLLSGVPIGLNAFVFVAVQWIVSDQRRFLMGQNFIMIWFGFCLFSAGAILVQWGLAALVQLHWLPVKPLLLPLLLGFVSFPVVYVLLHLTHKILPSVHSSIRFGSQS